MNATDASGRLKIIPNCYIQIGNFKFEFNNLPDLGDSKGANYEPTAGIGRASPIVTYSNSEQRSISCSINLFVQCRTDCKKNLTILRHIQSAVYPRPGSGAPYAPPVLCKLKFGSLLSEAAICCIMKNYNVKFPTDVPWDEETLCPYRMEISCEFEQVFASRDLPNQEKILKDNPLNPGTIPIFATT